MTEPSVPVGFDYAKAILEIRKHKTYEEIAAYCGYEGPAGVFGLVRGAIPSHPKGEAIWALYRELFERKPPVSPEQALGVGGSTTGGAGITQAEPTLTAPLMRP